MVDDANTSAIELNSAQLTTGVWQTAMQANANMENPTRALTNASLIQHAQPHDGKISPMPTC